MSTNVQLLEGRLPCPLCGMPIDPTPDERGRATIYSEQREGESPVYYHAKCWNDKAKAEARLVSNL